DMAAHQLDHAERGKAGRSHPRADPLAHLDGARADEQRLLLAVDTQYLRRDAPQLMLFRLIDDIRMVYADDRPVRRNLHYVERVDFAELFLFRLGGSGHAAQFGVEPEIVLEGDGGECLALVLDLDMLFGFDGLMQPIRIAATEHQAARILVHDDDFRPLAVVLDDVVYIFAEDAMRLHRRRQVVHQFIVVRQVLNTERPLDEGHARVGDGGRLRLLIHDIVDIRIQLVGVRVVLIPLGIVYAALHLGDDTINDGVLVGGLLDHAGDDQRRARLVNEDRVHLVHDGIVQFALAQFLLAELHIVAQVVEAELVVRSVGDVAGVGFGARAFAGVRKARVGMFVFGIVDIGTALVAGLRGLALDDADAHAEQVIDGAVPDRVALGQIVVDRDEVRAFAEQRIEIDGQRGDQRFAFARPHLRDASIVQHHAADKLDIVVAHSEGALGGFPHEREGFRQHRVQDRVVDAAVGLPALLVGEHRPARFGGGILPGILLLDALAQ